MMFVELSKLVLESAGEATTVKTGTVMFWSPRRCNIQDVCCFAYLVLALVDVARSLDRLKNNCQTELLSFKMNNDTIVVECNEDGFTSRDPTSICSKKHKVSLQGPTHW